MMTAFELRRHLSGGHDHPTRGLDHQTLEQLHTVDHETGRADHTHATVTLTGEAQVVPPFGAGGTTPRHDHHPLATGQKKVRHDAH